jgi:phosphoserine phosphatase
MTENGMSAEATERGLTVRDMEVILEVTSKLAAPFDLTTMLSEVVNAAKQVLHADRGSVWLYDAAADELSSKSRPASRRCAFPPAPASSARARTTRRIINVGDCYGDERFNRDVDRASGYRTRCMLALPLIDHKDVLVGVMQVLNKAGGVFDDDDEILARALAAQCAVALQRVRMTEALIEGEKDAPGARSGARRANEHAAVGDAVRAGIRRLRHVAPGEPDGRRHVRPRDAGAGTPRRAGRRDRSRHRPALSVTQMHAMLRMAFRLGADLETAFLQVNNQLAATISDDRFITAFIGLLDGEPIGALPQRRPGADPALPARSRRVRAPQSHELSAGRDAAFQAATAVSVDLEPGDVLALCPTASMNTAIAARAVRRGARRGDLRCHSAGRWPSSRRRCCPASRRSRKAPRRKTTSRSSS